MKEMAKAVGLRDADGYQKASEQLVTWTTLLNFWLPS
jgi:hypothetical protein